MESWENFKDRECTLYYKDGVEPDGTEHYSKKEGFIYGQTSTHLLIKEHGSNRLTGILLSSILRITFDFDFS